jgi:serine/threonine-protein kinase mTOR
MMTSWYDSDAFFPENAVHLTCARRIRLQVGLRSSKDELVHGSLLALTEAVRYPDDILAANHAGISDAVLRLREHRNTLVQRSVISLLPALAAYNADSFGGANRLDLALQHIIGVVRRERERGASLVILGQLVKAVGADCDRYCDAVMQLVRESLATKYAVCQHGPISTAHPG